jgi:hypothetical protein
MSSIFEQFHCLTDRTSALAFSKPPSCQPADGARRRTFSPCTQLNAVWTRRLRAPALHRVASVNSRRRSFASF